MHCEKPSCVEAAENNAVYKRPDGIVMIDPEKAVGQRQIRQRTQVMISLHQFLVTLLLEWMNGANHDLPQIQCNHLRMKYGLGLFITHPETIVHFFLQQMDSFQFSMKNEITLGKVSLTS